MGIVINDNLITFSPKPLDDRYGPYSSVAAANSAILSTVRFSGLTVGVYSGGETIEYWYKTGITNTDLVLKSGGGGGGISGSGTTNYVAKFTSSTAIGNTGSMIYDDGTNVGIGTTSPNAKLEVSGTTSIIGPWNGTPDNGLHLSFGPSNIGNIYSLQNGVSWRELQIEATPIALNFNTQSNVGVGTRTPVGKLEVNLNNTDYNNVGGANSHLLLNNPNANGQTSILFFNNGVRNGKIRNDYIGGMSYVSEGSNDYHIFFTGGDFGVGDGKLRIWQNGNVFIGNNAENTLDTGYQLSVKGSVQLSGLTNIAQSNVVSINTTTGQLFYQPASSGGITTGNTISSCGDNVKINASSGYFYPQDNLPAPDIKVMYIGNTSCGFNGCEYEASAFVLGNGTMLYCGLDFSFCGIPLPTDLTKNDKIKICGHVMVPDTVDTTSKFYITVSAGNCSNFTTGGGIIDFGTIIPVAEYTFDNGKSVCFSEEVTLNSTLNGCDTHLFVGMNSYYGGNNIITRFSYTLDAIKYSCSSDNMLIRNCCDPAYYEIILNNGLPVGYSFVDNEGNCWNIESLTTSSISGSRTFIQSYTGCTSCISNNPCPNNLSVQNCCDPDQQFFSGALPGIGIGDIFVDNYGFCWEVVDETGLPITNTVSISGSGYTGCNDCMATNVCPTKVIFSSCCTGYKDVGILENVPGAVIGDFFVDQFGECWEIQDYNGYAFPALNFITGSTIYIDCTECKNSNTCPESHYYTIQNCCDESIEVIYAENGIPIGTTLFIVSSGVSGCYKILYWSNVGPATIVNYEFNKQKSCNDCIEIYLNKSCPGLYGCCTTFKNVDDGNSALITGFGCDGSYLYNYSLAASGQICLSVLISYSGGPVVDNGPCCFGVHNLSLTENLNLAVTFCDNSNGNITVTPDEYYDGCFQCVQYQNISDQDIPWEPYPCP